MAKNFNVNVGDVRDAQPVEIGPPARRPPTKKRVTGKRRGRPKKTEAANPAGTGSTPAKLKAPGKKAAGSGVVSKPKPKEADNGAGPGRGRRAINFGEKPYGVIIGTSPTIVESFRTLDGALAFITKLPPKQIFKARVANIKLVNVETKISI